jgi:tungstate transport system substrate-binding protein
MLPAIARSVGLPILVIALAGCSRPGPDAPVSGPSPGQLRLATTTSTDDSGLLRAILPAFEQANRCRVDVVAVGTGQALEIAGRGDADVVLVHSPAAEATFLQEGHGAERFDVMYNDFVLVGPRDDPAGVGRASSARDAFKAISTAKAPFVSRGDRSGTHAKELSFWAALDLIPGETQAWYTSIGQGMGETLVFANEQDAYTLGDRATYVSMRGKLPNLIVVCGGTRLEDNRDRELLNAYGVIPVSPARHPNVNARLAATFVEWMISPETQRRIGEFGRDRFGEALFRPDSAEYKATRALRVSSGGSTRTFTLADLQALPHATVPDYEVVGVKRGPLGKATWTGASVKDVLLAVDPALGDRRNSDRRMTVRSSDGYAATLKWEEVFGTPRGGEALYNVKGCNECHGVEGEGTAPAGKRPAPRLAGAAWDPDRVRRVLRSGHDAHGGLNPYDDAQLNDRDLRAILSWLDDSHPSPKAAQGPPASGARAPAAAWLPDSRRTLTLVAYEKNGKPMTGRDGLLQLVVGIDQFAGRYAHWVASIEVTDGRGR